jgi:hypothetical protein
MGSGAWRSQDLSKLPSPFRGSNTAHIDKFEIPNDHYQAQTLLNPSFSLSLNPYGERYIHQETITPIYDKYAARLRVVSQQPNNVPQ